MPMSKTLIIMNKIDFLGAHVYELTSDDYWKIEFLWSHAYEQNSDDYKKD